LSVGPLPSSSNPTPATSLPAHASPLDGIPASSIAPPPVASNRPPLPRSPGGSATSLPWIHSRRCPPHRRRPPPCQPPRLYFPHLSRAAGLHTPRHPPPSLPVRSVSAVALASPPRVSRPAHQQRWVQRVPSSRPSPRQAASWAPLGSPPIFSRPALPPINLSFPAPRRFAPSFRPMATLSRPPASLFHPLLSIVFSFPIIVFFQPITPLSRLFLLSLRCPLPFV
jgi:hypothetical protein